MDVHQRLHRRHPLDRRVEHVPDQAEAASGAQRAVNVCERALGVEPVERLGDGDRIDRAGGHRDRLGGALEHLDPGERGREHVAASPRPARPRSRSPRSRPASASACRCRRPGRAPSRPAARPSSAARWATAAGGYPGPAALVRIGGAAEARRGRWVGRCHRARTLTLSKLRSPQRTGEGPPVTPQELRVAQRAFGMLRPPHRGERRVAGLAELADRRVERVLAGEDGVEQGRAIPKAIRVAEEARPSCERRNVGTRQRRG